MGYIAGTAVSVTQIATAALLNQDISENLQWIHDNRSDTSNYGVTPQQATGTANLGLTSSWQTVPGATLTLTQTGNWLIFGVLDLQTSSAAGQHTFVGQITVNGTAQAGLIATTIPENIEVSVSNVWHVDLASQPGTVALQAGWNSIPALGGGTAFGVNSRLTAGLMGAP